MSPQPPAPAVFSGPDDVARAILATALGTERPARELRAKAYSAAVFWALVTVTFLAMLLLAVQLRVHVR